MPNNNKLYQLYDRKAGLPGGPIITAKNPTPAIRSFYSVLENPNTDPGRYPEDFELRFLGEQDEETGVIIAEKQPYAVATGAGWLESQRKAAAVAAQASPADQR